MYFLLNGGGSHACLELLTTWVDEIICQVLKELKNYLSTLQREDVNCFLVIN
jgi:hypothetical protein